jgi:hypothetical protein
VTQQFVVTHTIRQVGIPALPTVGLQTNFCQNVVSTRKLLAVHLWRNIQEAFVQQLLQWKNNEYYVLCVCVCSLRYPCAILYYHLSPVWLYSIFPLYLINGAIFWNKSLNIKMCVLIFSATFVWNISDSKKSWEKYQITCICFPVKHPLFLSNINQTWIYWQVFPKNTQITNSMKISLMEAELF